MKIDKLKTIFLCIGLFFLFNSCSQGQNEVQNEIQNVSQDGWQMVWSDEFDYEGLPDTKKWSYDVGDGCPNVCAWGNNELEHYTKDSLKNARVENGHLIIEAHKELIGNSRYSSARLVSKDKGDWKYGKIKVRAKLPSGIGTWPAIWMLSTDWEYGGWPESGEIDIMEHVGYDRDTVVGTVHTKAYHHSIGTHQNGKIAKADFEENFHIFVIEWSEDKIDNEKKTFNEWPFDKRFHLILNLAVGGNWGGKMGVDEKIWPQKMEVDYVRVYQ
jgi:beta-glucanase (GH16 family)